MFCSSAQTNVWPLSTVSRTMKEDMWWALKTCNIASFTSTGFIVLCNITFFTLPLEASTCLRFPFGKMELYSFSKTTVTVMASYGTWLLLFSSSEVKQHTLLLDQNQVILYAFEQQEREMPGRLLVRETSPVKLYSVLSLWSSAEKTINFTFLTLYLCAGFIPKSNHNQEAHCRGTFILSILWVLST